MEPLTCELLSFLTWTTINRSVLIRVCVNARGRRRLLAFPSVNDLLELKQALVYPSDFSPSNTSQVSNRVVFHLGVVKPKPN